MTEQSTASSSERHSLRAFHLCRVLVIGCKIEMAGKHSSRGSTHVERRSGQQTFANKGSACSQATLPVLCGETLQERADCRRCALCLSTWRPVALVTSAALVFSQANSKYRSSSTELASWDAHVSSFPIKHIHHSRQICAKPHERCSTKYCVCADCVLTLLMVPKR